MYVQKMAVIPQPGVNLKGKQTMLIPPSYGRQSWPSLNAKQQEIVIKAWNALSDEVKDRIRKEISANDSVVPPNAPVPNTSAAGVVQLVHTNINHRARLMHTFLDPTLTITWTAAHSSFNRAELDDKEGRTDHWNVIASSFNDNTNIYFNPTFDSTSGSANPGMEV